MYLKKNYEVTTQIPSPDPALPEVVSLDQLARYLSAIQVDINNLHRELTYWDLYKINYVIDDASKANSVINSLSPGQAAVIGLENSEIIDNKKRSRGDIVIKLINNQLFWIDSKSSGVYVPDHYENNTIVYKYTNENRTEGEEVEITGATSTISKNIYGILKEVSNLDTSTTFDAFSRTDGGNTYYIRPIVRFYTEQNETIDIPFALTLSGNIYTVAWDANPLLKYIQVK